MNNKVSIISAEEQLQIMYNYVTCSGETDYDEIVGHASDVLTMEYGYGLWEKALLSDLQIKEFKEWLTEED